MGAGSGVPATVQIIGGKYQPSDADASDTLTVSAVSSPTANNATVTTDGTSVTYTALSTFAGSDSFTYTVSDSQGGTDIGTVTVTVTNPGGGNGKNVVIQDLGGGNVRIIIGGTAGVCYQLQYASSVPSAGWTPLGSVIAMPTGGISVYDDTGVSGARFYRTVVVTCP